IRSAKGTLEVRHQGSEARLVHIRDQPGLPEATLALRGLRLQLVALPPAAPLELAGRGALEPLCRRALGLHLGHVGAPLFTSFCLTESGRVLSEPWARGSCSACGLPSAGDFRSPRRRTSARTSG